MKVFPVGKSDQTIFLDLHHARVSRSNDLDDRVNFIASRPVLVPWTSSTETSSALGLRKVGFRHALERVEKIEVFVLVEPMQLKDHERATGHIDSEFHN